MDIIDSHNKTRAVAEAAKNTGVAEVAAAAAPAQTEKKQTADLTLPELETTLPLPADQPITDIGAEQIKTKTDTGFAGTLTKKQIEQYSAGGGARADSVEKLLKEYRKLTSPGGRPNPRGKNSARAKEIEKELKELGYKPKYSGGK
jgi:hypothetical protein